MIKIREPVRDAVSGCVVDSHLRYFPTPTTIFMDIEHARKHKRKGSHHDHDRKKSKKRHNEDGSSKSSKKGRHKAVNLVDDDVEDDQMWVEHNIDVDGQHVSTLFYLRFYTE